MRSRPRWSPVALALMVFGCAPTPTRALLELSDREGQFYRELRPALTQARETFEVGADALITSTAARQAAMMRREMATTRQAIYEPLAGGEPSSTAIAKAIADLAAADAAVETRVEKEKAAGQQRISAIVQTLEALDTTLEGITENHQAIHGHLESRRHLFRGPGRSAFLPFTTFAELRTSLRSAIETLKEQFRLAKELVAAARKEFAQPEKANEP